MPNTTQDFSEWAEKPPLYVLKLVFGPSKDRKLLAELKRSGCDLGDRKSVLDTIYKHPWFSEYLTYLRQPSLEKRVLVDQLVQELSRRRGYTWLTSKTLHAIAFRPESFENRIAPPGQKTWGPLYKRRRIKKGGGRYRYLDIPNPVLRHIQMCLLRSVLVESSSWLPPYVYGAGGRTQDVFHNAEKHLKQKFIASFDLKDFFPSVRTDQIIAALCRQMKAGWTPAKTKTDRSKLAARKIGQDRRPARDAALLIAKLCTCRGRLPQGAPTSPLLANLAFLLHDEKIRDLLGRDVVYTRYFDDITISVSSDVATKLKLTTPRDLKGYAESHIAKVLEPTTFTLNPRKSRSGSLKNGFLVTGLFASNNSVSIPGRMRRNRIRAAVHGIKQHGFVDWATGRTGSEYSEQTKHASSYRGQLRKGRRISTEKLALRLLRNRVKDLEVEHLRESSETLRLRGITGNDLRKGDEAWQWIGETLDHIWRGELNAVEADGNQMIVRAGDRDFLNVRSEPKLQFLALSREDAIVVVERWLQLDGLRAFLAAAPNDPRFSSVHECETQLRQTLAAITFKTQTKQPARPVVVSETLTAPPVGDQDHFVQNMKAVKLLLREHAEICEIDEDAFSEEDGTRRRADSKEELALWFDHLQKLLFKRLHKMPSIAPANPEHRSNVIKFIQIAADCLNNRRCNPYDVVKRFHDRYKWSENSATANPWLALQRKTSDDLNWLLQKWQWDRNAVDFHNWRDQLENGPAPIRMRLESAARRFLDLHIKCETQFFQPLTLDSKCELNDELNREATAKTSKEAWNTVLSTALRIVKYTKDTLAGKLKPKEAKDIRNQRLVRELKARLSDQNKGMWNKVYLLRCREGHGLNEDNKKDWQRCQRNVANALGRDWTKQTLENMKGMYGPEHLQLTEHEATVTKLWMLEGFCRIFEELLDSQPGEQSE